MYNKYRCASDDTSLVFYYLAIDEVKSENLNTITFSLNFYTALVCMVV